MSGAADVSASGSLLPLLKDADPLRYTAALYKPEDKREAIASLYLFQADIERIRDLVSEPLPGEIRLQWWRDVIAGMRDGEAQQSPLASALLQTIETNGLARQRFADYLDAMEFDLYDDPMPSTSSFEGFMGETQSVFFQMVAQILNSAPLPDGDASGHAGIAFGVMRCLENMAKHRARGQIYIPKDMLDVQGISPEDWRASNQQNDAKLDVVRAFASYGLMHLDKAQSASAQWPKHVRTALLPISVCKSVLERAKRQPEKALAGSCGVGVLRVQWSMLKAALRG